MMFNFIEVIIILKVILMYWKSFHQYIKNSQGGKLFV